MDIFLFRLVFSDFGLLVAIKSTSFSNDIDDFKVIANFTSFVNYMQPFFLKKLSIRKPLTIANTYEAAGLVEVGTTAAAETK